MTRSISVSLVMKNAVFRFYMLFVDRYCRNLYHLAWTQTKVVGGLYIVI